MKHDESICIGVLIEEFESLTYSEVCKKYHLPKELLLEMMDYGLFDNKSSELEQLKLNQVELHRIESALRLHKDLGINLPGVVLALELLAKIDEMEGELSILRKHF